MLQELGANNVTMSLTDFAFSVLDKVAQPGYTKWSIVYDITHREIHFKTAAGRDVKTIRFSGFDFACTATSKILDMNRQAKGDVTAHFKSPDKALQKNILDQAVAESSRNVSISEKEKDAILHYSEGIKCK